MKTPHQIITAFLIAFSIVTLHVSNAIAATPKVVTVPATAVNPAVPHDTWSGLEISLKGTAHDPDGDSTLDTYEWDFGDGSPPATGGVSNPYVIEERHTYTGAIGDKFVAKLTVTDTDGEIGSDTYLVEIKDGSDIRIKVNVAISEGLWRLHKDMIRGTFTDDIPYGFWADTITWTRISGSDEDIIGGWHLLVDGAEYNLTLNPDDSFTLAGLVDCGGGISEYTASGTYSYIPAAGVLTLNVTSSDFECEGIDVGIQVFTVTSISSTSMIWVSGPAVAYTGASTEAFEIHGSLPTGDPNLDPYVDTVQRGLNYLLSTMQSYPVSQDPTYCPLGDPDVNGNNIGLLSCAACDDAMYEQGIALMALSSSGCPTCTAATGIPEVNGKSYLEIAQDMVDYLAYAQTDPSAGVYRGGWRYTGNTGDSDNSVSQWPVIGFEAAETNFGLAGLQVPQFVRDELNLWVDYIQNDTSGGSGYMNPDGTNIARTGGLLAEMKFLGDTTTSPRVQSAVEYIYNNWVSDPDHFLSNSYYAFYSVMKGFRLLGIDTIHPINDPTGSDWYGDPTYGYAQYLVSKQSQDGAWYQGQWASHPLTSAWAILTLKKTVVQPGPIAEAGPDVSSYPPLVDFTFDGTGSYHPDPGRNIVNYSWQFGDGSDPVNGAVVTHAFPAAFNPDGSIDWDATANVYEVTLQVTDNNTPPLTDSDILTVHITPPPWPPIADANGAYTAQQCQTISLIGSASQDPNGELYPDPNHPWHSEIISWEWDFDNDGQYDDANGETVTWSSCDLGIHVVGLKVTNSFNESDEHDTTIDVVEVAPVHVNIDIKPGSDPNCFNPNGHGSLPVAVIGSAELDVMQIDVESLLLQGLTVKAVGKQNKFMTHYENITNDEYLDLIIQFEDNGQLIPSINGYATLTGVLADGTPIEGSDTICLTPKH